MTSILKCLNYVSIILFIGCHDHGYKNLNYQDTIYKSQILEVNNGDTIRRYDTIYFKPTASNIDISNFHYGARLNSGNGSDNYQIFFERQEVIFFCDSMLNVLRPYKNQGDDEVFYQRLSYEVIRKQALNYKMDEAIYADELSILLDRFNPLILNTKKDDTPKYLIISYEGTKYAEYKVYRTISKFGDTINLAATCIRPQEVQLEK